MPSNSSRGAVVVLKDGLSVSKSALDLAWDLEDRGHELRVADDGEHLLVSTDGLTEQHCQQIRRYKPEIISLIKYYSSTSVD